MGLLWDRGTRLGNVSMQRVGMGLMSFVFARVWVMPRRSDVIGWYHLV